MLAESILQRLEAEFDNPPETIRAVAAELAAGASAEHLAMFRRDETGDPGEERIQQIAERLATLQEIETRRETIVSQATEQERGDVEELRELLAGSVDQDLLDDVDHALRAGAGRAEQNARELGLGELIDAILGHDLGGATPREAAEKHVREVDGLRSPDEVLAQIVLVLAERFGEDPKLRQRLRTDLSRGILTATAIGKGGRREAPAPAEESPAAAEESSTDASATDAPTTDAPAAEAPADAADTDTPATEASAEAPPPEAGTEEPAPDAAAEASAPEADAGAPDAGAPDADATTETPAAESADAAPAGEGEASEAEATPPEATGGETPRKGDGKGQRGRGRKGEGRYQDLIGLRESIRRIPAGRLLALRRAEREGFLALGLELEAGRELEIFRQRFSPDVDPSTPLGGFLDLVYGHTYDQGVHAACEQTVRQRMKEKADRETVRTFSRSLRAQLMAPALVGERIAALRVAGRTAWFVALHPDGSPREKKTFPVPTDETGRGELVKALCELLSGENAPFALAVPHGKRERATGRLVQDVMAALEGTRPAIVPVDETASIIWATSASARKRHGSSDNGLRTTLSLARRLRDPLAELMRVEPRGLGLGQQLTEVHQGLLRRQLDATASSCLAHIGVDVNRADQPLLARLPGVSSSLARAIVQHRSEHGPFTALSGLNEVESIDEARFAHIAGMLRIYGGTDVLDATGVHPGDYPVVQKISEVVGKPVEELLGQPLDRRIDRPDIDDMVGELRLREIIHALRRGTNDPRGRVETFQNEGVNGFDDLKVDAQLQGRVTNLAEFGAFIDLGIGQDGLVHLSQIPGSRLRDPARVLRVGEIVSVFVVHLDPKGKKIGLSMLKPRHLAEGRPATLGERMGGGGRRGGGRRGGGTGGGPGGGRGRGRGHDQDERQPAMGRAARAPEGRRGGTRRGPRPKAGGGGGDRRGPGGGFGDERRGRGPRDGGKPRVMTFESDRTEKEVRGHKGELTSLSNLKALLGGGEQAKPADSGGDAPERSGEE